MPLPSASGFQSASRHLAFADALEAATLARPETRLGQARLANLFNVAENCRLAGINPGAYLVDMIAWLPGLENRAHGGVCADPSPAVTA